MTKQYYRNIRTLAQCQEAFDHMEPPEYYEQPDENEDENKEEGEWTSY